MQSDLCWVDLGWKVLVQVVEKKTRSMEDEICQLQKQMEERNGQLGACASAANQVRFVLPACARQVCAGECSVPILCKWCPSSCIVVSSHDYNFLAPDLFPLILYHLFSKGAFGPNECPFCNPEPYYEWNAQFTQLEI